MCKFSLWHWIKGLLSGLAGKPLVFVPSASMYLFKDTVLPVLPSFNRKMFPYMYITFDSGSVYTLHAMSMPVMAKSGIICGNNTENPITREFMPVLWRGWKCSDVHSGWVPETPVEQSSVTSWAFKFMLWTNVSVLDAEGNVAFEAYEPTPI